MGQNAHQPERYSAEESKKVKPANTDTHRELPKTSLVLQGESLSKTRRRKAYKTTTRRLLVPKTNRNRGIANGNGRHKTFNGRREYPALGSEPAASALKGYLEESKSQSRMSCVERRGVFVEVDEQCRVQ